MASKREITYGIILTFVCVPFAVFALYKLGAIQNIMTVVDTIIAETLAGVAVAGLVLIVHGARKEIPVEMKSRIEFSGKKSDWLSRHRVFVKEGKENDFWIVTTVCLITGVFVILLALAFSFTAPHLQPEAVFVLHTVTATMIGAGSLFIGIFGWLAGNQAYNMYESKKQAIVKQKEAYQKLIKDFEISFDAVQQVSEPKTKLKMLAYFQDRLYDLCNKSEWRLEKDRINKILQNLSNCWN